MNLLNIFPVIISSVTNSEPHLAVDPWQVAEDDFPVNGSTTEKLKFLLNYAILAPSTHNAQPWLFTLVDDAVELYEMAKDENDEEKAAATRAFQISEDPQPRKQYT